MLIVIILALKSSSLCGKEHDELASVEIQHRSLACLTRCGKGNESGPSNPAELALLSARTNKIMADSPEPDEPDGDVADNSASLIAPTVQTFNANVEEDPDQNAIVDSTTEDTDQEDDTTEAVKNPEVMPTDLSLHPFHVQQGAAINIAG